MLRLFALLMAGLMSLSALAFERPFPAHALRGKMTPGYFPDISIDGKPRQLSPAARIFNQDNMIEMPAAIRGSDIVVNYTVDMNGNIDRIWILTPEEAAQKLPTSVAK
ncbi:hypothetical protein [Duganella sp. HH101]|uniref:hypothetical protein n=1 Tax=Duganella sp. HH101 TaxID=1781066 RepID=UPI000873E4F0|nr:hypothetical protein [Duganella sp. HH101]OFA02600.1 hypothetical protein DUGA2_34500 [Duganella sp. HH101]